MFVRERSLLKSALYSQLDLLDTNDAIVHLNQLENRLVEQVRSSSVAVKVVIILETPLINNARVDLRYHRTHKQETVKSNSV